MPVCFTFNYVHIFINVKSKVIRNTEILIFFFKLFVYGFKLNLLI